MKNIFIAILILIIGLLIGSKVQAGWGRLVMLDEKAGDVYIVYDKLEKVNCYVLFGTREGAISCLKAEK